MELSKKTIIVFVLFCAVIIITPIGFYIYNFGRSSLSDSPGDWGVLGDYIGGILNPFVAILNILLFVYLTIYVDKQDHKKMFNQFRYDAYLEFSRLLNSFDPKSATIEETTKLYKEIDLIAFSHQFLFEGKDNTTYQKLIGTMRSIISSIEIYKEGYESLKVNLDVVAEKHPIIKPFIGSENIMEQDLVKFYEQYRLQRQTFIGFVQRVIADGDTKPYESWNIDKFMENIEKRREVRNKKV